MFKKLLFVDLEYANSLEGNNKICSFGYVLTDNKFNVIESKDLLCNPEARFLLNNISKHSIVLGYDFDIFENLQNFTGIYNDIYSLLTMKDTLVIFFSAGGDISALYYACNRYGLEFPEFIYTDTQEIFKCFSNESVPVSLDFINDFFETGLKRNEHTSKYDAFMTLHATKHMLNKLNCTFDDLYHKHKGFFSTFFEYANKKEYITDSITEIEREIIKESKQSIIETSLNYFTCTLKSAYASNKNKEFSFYISVSQLEKDFPRAMKLIYHLGKSGYIYSNESNVKSQTYYNSFEQLARRANQKTFNSIIPYNIEFCDDPVVLFFHKFDGTLGDLANIFVNYTRFYQFKRFIGKIKKRIVNKACSLAAEESDISHSVNIKESEKKFDTKKYRELHNHDDLNNIDITEGD